MIDVGMRSGSPSCWNTRPTRLVIHDKFSRSMSGSYHGTINECTRLEWQHPLVLRQVGAYALTCASNSETRDGLGMGDRNNVEMNRLNELANRLNQGLKHGLRDQVVRLILAYVT